MSFEKKTWYNKDSNGNIPDGAPRFDADNMNRVEEGISTIETALETKFTELGVTKIVTGTYTGDGNASQFIDLGFTPSAVLVAANSGRIVYTPLGDGSNGEWRYGGLALNGHGTPAVNILENGFTVYSSGNSGVRNRANDKKTYYYIAFK